MKKLVLAFVILTSGLYCIQAQTKDFREFSWGTSIGKVQSTENKANFIDKIKDDELIYSDVLAGSDCIVTYIFNDNDKLISGIYIFTKLVDNPQLYLQDYKRLKTLLTEKYGEPVKEVFDDGNTQIPVDQYNFGQDVANGDMIIYSIWNTERSLIKFMITSRDYHPSLEIHYTTRSMDELEDKSELQKALIKL